MIKERALLPGSVAQKMDRLLVSVSLQVGFHNQEFASQHLAFVGCFTFKRKYFNQFRLYGKSDYQGLEAGGVAIGIDASFLHMAVGLGTTTRDMIHLNAYDKTRSKALYRCVYYE